MPPTRYGWEDDHVSLALLTEIGEHDSYRKAIKTDDYGKCITAMEQEMESLIETKHGH